MDKPQRYLVTMYSHRWASPAILEVPTFLGKEAAGRRARMTAFSQGWADLDEIVIAEITLL